MYPAGLTMVARGPEGGRVLCAVKQNISLDTSLRRYSGMERFKSRWQRTSVICAAFIGGRAISILADNVLPCRQAARGGPLFRKRLRAPVSLRTEGWLFNMQLPVAPLLTAKPGPLSFERTGVSLSCEMRQAMHLPVSVS